MTLTGDAAGELARDAAAAAGGARDSRLNLDRGRVERTLIEETLTSASGKVLSQANAQSASYAGQDTSGMALTLINEQAEEVVARLYSDYCGKSNAR